MTPAPLPAPSSGPRASRRGNPVPEARVAAMFDAIAPVYDRMNTLMSAGLDGRWRRAAVAAAALRPGDSAIDLACGTGKLTRGLAERVGPSGRVAGVDLSPRMLGIAREQLRDLPQVELVPGTALELPFADATFDAATIAFGLRNLSSFEAGFREMARVVRPGGRVVCLELSMPPRPAIARPYKWAFDTLAPLGGRTFGHRGAYTYLPHSLDGFPAADELAATMRSTGLRRVTIRRLTLGVVAIHAAEVAATPA